MFSGGKEMQTLEYILNWVLTWGCINMQAAIKGFENSRMTTVP